MLSFFPRGVLDEILNLIESVSEGFPSYFWWRHDMLKVAKIVFKIPRYFKSSRTRQHPPEKYLTPAQG